MIAGRGVGAGQRVLIVAEAGVNHDGSVEKALRLVDVAADAGADVVKFQMFRAAELVTAGATPATYQRAAGESSQHEMLRRLELSEADFSRVRRHCDARGIVFLATPFGPQDVARLLPLGVPALKLASTDIDNMPLLRRAAETGLPLIVSTGAATEAELDACVARLRDWGAGGRLILLHCVSGYPTPLDAANLRVIATLRERYGVPCGFSDHTPVTQIAGWAVAAGACVLEKHFTLDPSAPGPDHAMSLSPAQLAEYVAAAHTAETALGTGALGFTEIEADVRRAARKSVVAAADIPAGTALTAELLTVKRPGGGIPPGELAALVGRRAVVDIAADTILTRDMLQ